MKLSIENIALTDNTTSEYISDFFEMIKQKYKYNIIPWKPIKETYPDNMLLGTDKGILAYIKIFHYSDDKNNNIVGFAHETQTLLDNIRVVDSDLDRPVFYIHVLRSPEGQNIFFETTEQIKDIIYSGDFNLIKKNEKNYFCSLINNMGTFEELMNIFADLKKNNVHWY